MVVEERIIDRREAQVVDVGHDEEEHRAAELLDRRPLRFEHLEPVSQPSSKLWVLARVGCLETSKLSADEEDDGVRRSARVVGSIGLAKVDAPVGAEAVVEEAAALVHVRPLLGVLPKEGFPIELGHLDLDAEQAEAGGVEDGGGASELPESYEEVPLARLVDGEVHRDVEGLERLGDAHGLVDGEAPFAVLDDDVHRVDDARPHVGK